MPQFSRATSIGVSSRKKIPSSVEFRIAPAYPGTSCTVVNFANVGGVISLTTGATYNITPNTTFTANVMIWGAAGGSSGSNGGGGGFASGTMTFFANIAYNVVIGTGGSASGTGGGGSGIEYLANSNVFIVAGGGGGGAPGGVGGAGGGWAAANGAPGTGATAFVATSPGTLRRGGDGSGGAGFGAGGSGAGGGGGGLYGGASSGSGGGGGGGFYDSILMTSANLQTGNSVYAGGNNMPGYSLYGLSSIGPGAGSNGAILITIL